MVASSEPCKPPALLFDLDGTLIDSVPDIAAALNTVLVRAGRHPLTDDEVTALVGAGARTLVVRALDQTAPVGEPSIETSTIDRLYQDFLANYDAEPFSKTRLYPGAITALKDVRQRGMKTAIITNKPHDLTLRILHGLEIAGLFDVVVGASDARPLKPHRAMIDYALEQLSCDITQAAFIGDSGADVDAAKAAGIPVVLLTHGYMNAEAGDLSADIVLDHFDSLASAIRQLLG
ncbi:MAG: HAD-IA family hydrolase [Pseudomonadota bacterium]